MSTLIFQVSGSQGDIYTVRAGLKEPGNAWITCTCKAGENRIYCKHRFALLDGIVDDLLSGNEPDVTKLQELVKGTDIERCLKRVDECEKRKEAAVREWKRAKHELAISMYD